MTPAIAAVGTPHLTWPLSVPAVQLNPVKLLDSVMLLPAVPAVAAVTVTVVVPLAVARVLPEFLVIALAMFPSFHRQVSPQLPGKIGKPYYALASAHAALGVIAEIGGLYILLAAGTSLLPRRLRLTRYKFWMRIVLAAWWLVLLLGMATYARWYVPLR